MLTLRSLPFLILLMVPNLFAHNDIPSQPKGLFELYQQNRELNIPNYITADFIALCFGMRVEEERLRIEEEILAPGFTELIDGMIDAVEIDSNLNGNHERYRQTAHGFLSVLHHLINEPESSPVNDPVARELRMIHDGSGIYESPILGQSLDYTRFRVRGRYTETAALARYFRAWTYASAPLFYLNASGETGISENQANHLTRTAIYLTALIRNKAHLHQIWNNLEATTRFWFGPPDGPTLEDYPVTVEASLTQQRKDLLAAFRHSGKQPRVLSVPMEVTGSHHQRHTDAATGWRLIPQRYTADNAALSQLVFPHVGRLQVEEAPMTMTLAGGVKVKGFPRATELLALMGSDQATAQLRSSGDIRYEGYPTAFAKARREMGRAVGVNAENLEITRLLDETVGSNTAAAFWTRCRHATLLYVAPSYTMIAKGIDRNPREWAELERKPELYRTMAEAMERLDRQSGNRMGGGFSKLLYRLSALAQQTDALNHEDIAFLNNLDLWMLQFMNGGDLPLTVDIHTDLNSRRVLQEAVGQPEAVFTHVGTERARGGRMTHLEFKKPMQERMNNREWEDETSTVNASDIGFFSREPGNFNAYR